MAKNAYKNSKLSAMMAELRALMLQGARDPNVILEAVERAADTGDVDSALTITEAAEALRVTRATVYRWLSLDPELGRRVFSTPDGRRWITIDDVAKLRERHGGCRAGSGR